MNRLDYILHRLAEFSESDRSEIYGQAVALYNMGTNGSFENCLTEVVPFSTEPAVRSAYLSCAGRLRVRFNDGEKGELSYLQLIGANSELDKVLIKAREVPKGFQVRKEGYIIWPNLWRVAKRYRLITNSAPIILKPWDLYRLI